MVTVNGKSWLLVEYVFLYEHFMLLLLCFQVLGNSTPKNATITYRKDKIFNTLLKHIGNVSFEGVRQLKNWLSLKNKMRLNSHDIDLEALLFLS